jgi:tripartite-type tricarboxylate transporter receptor subunit TctC
MKRRDVLVLGLSALTAPALKALPTSAQPRYPERPIRVVIPFPPGGVNDGVGRPWAERMKTLLGTVVIENVGGAGGALGATTVARAQPDGYTLLMGSGGTHVILPIATSRPQYDPVKEFEHITILGVTALAIGVHPGMPVKTAKELIDYAKANPGKLSYGSAGTGTVSHLAGELFKSLTGLQDIVHVPYRGGGPATADAIAGHVPMIMPNVTSQLIDLHKSGKLRLLAVTTPVRVEGAPDIPTAVESGLPGMIAQNFIALMAPSGTAKPIIDQIAQATRTAMADGEFRQALVASGFEPHLDSGPDKARRFIEDEIARWTPIIKATGLKLD